MIFPKLFGAPPNPDKVKELEEVLVKCKEMMETYFLKDTKFIAGDEIPLLTYKRCVSSPSSECSMWTQLRAIPGLLSG